MADIFGVSTDYLLKDDAEKIEKNSDATDATAGSESIDPKQVTVIIEDKKPKKRGCLWFLVPAAILVGLFWVFATLIPSVHDDFTTEADYSEYSYDELIRTPDAYEGSKIKITGEVFQVIEVDDETQLILNTNGDSLHNVYVYYDSDIVDQRVLEGDNVTVYGISEGLHTYENVAGGSVTLPLVAAQKIVIG